ncbi:MAG: hypothetical protein KBC98_01910 [Candidatus Pacebacteria bacterium]|nr:hypothetical protein [Candidatus Paceibacterota bacterium]
MDRKSSKNKVSHDEKAHREEGISPIYFIGFLVIMLFALVLHFIPSSREATDQLVEPRVEAIPL